MGNQVNNTLTYLDLLELVKIGKQPKRIKYSGSEFNWDGNEGNYIDYSSSGLNKFFDHRIGVVSSMKRCCERRDIEVLPNRTQRILDTVERNYLKNALVPLRVTKVRLVVNRRGERSWIECKVPYDNTVYSLPWFDMDTMYTGMVPDRWYDLEYLLSLPTRPVEDESPWEF